MSAASTLGDEDALIRQREVVKHLIGVVVVDDRADGYFDLEIGATAAMTVTASAVTAAFGAKCVVEAKFEKSVFVRVCDEIDIAAAASTSAIGTAARHKLLAPEGNASMPAIAGFDHDLGFIDKHTINHKGTKT